MGDRFATLVIANGLRHDRTQNRTGVCVMTFMSEYDQLGYANETIDDLRKTVNQLWRSLASVVGSDDRSALKKMHEQVGAKKLPAHEKRAVLSAIETLLDTIDYVDDTEGLCDETKTKIHPENETGNRR